MIFDFTWYAYRNNIGPEVGGAFKLVRDSTDIKAFEDSSAYTMNCLLYTSPSPRDG